MIMSGGIVIGWWSWGYWWGDRQFLILNFYGPYKIIYLPFRDDKSTTNIRITHYVRYIRK